ncbi:spondin-2 [Pectinophora gossypiella]|uniref:spondin-2 n=1 Tax=Pectinophora gossypiella TaxID=13191 RepID=UPI00214F1878|nr:spondin-2 [Pectinophora gossypiella]
MARVLFALLPVLASAAAVALVSLETDGCNPDKMTVYKMVLHTYWTREKFPKHYPDWRPPAQWSKIYGASHDRAYTLFRLGRRVSPAVRQFAETGRSDALGSGPGRLDMFDAPAITQGSGRTEAEFFVDGNHSRVSLMARMIPSPDWFIGVDGFDLCVDGNWLDSITIEVDPLDAGTDNGFTFTAPNWPTAPQGVAYRITSKYPSHPAGSFFYPHLRRLPPIATFQFIKLREYELSEVFHRSSDDQKYDVLQLDKLSHNSIDVLDGNRALSIAEEVERAEQAPRIYAQGSLTTPDSSYAYYSLTNTTGNTTEEPRSANQLPSSGPTASERSALRSLARRYRARRRRRLHADDNADPAERRKRKRSKQRDCRVSQWGDWSSCRGHDGGCFGTIVRKRKILRQPKPDGNPCPPTTQSRWCTTSCTATLPPDWHETPDWRENLT